LGTPGYQGEGRGKKLEYSGKSSSTDRWDRKKEKKKKGPFVSHLIKKRGKRPPYPDATTTWRNQVIRRKKKRLATGGFERGHEEKGKYVRELRAIL